MADPITVAAIGLIAALLLVVVLVVVLRRRDPVGHAVAGYAVMLRALRETAARATSPPPSPPPAPPGSRDAPPTVSVITSTREDGQGQSDSLG